MLTVCRSLIKYKPKTPSSSLKPRVASTTTKSPFLSPTLLSPKIGARVWKLLVNRYTITAAVIICGYKLMAKTKSGKKPVASTSKVLKRKSMETPSKETMVDTDSDEEFSDFGEGSSPTRIKVKGGVREEFKSRYANQNIGSRTIILGKPVRGSFLTRSKVLERLEVLGMSSFFTELPVYCYPNLVRTFYGNLHENDKGNCVSFVKGAKITLNSVILSSMLGIGLSTLSICSKGESAVVDGFGEMDQLKMVLADKDVFKVELPSVSKVLPLAHLLFQLSVHNVCPRLGTESKFSHQDLIFVSMIMAWKSFDLSSLILKNMLEVVEGSPTDGLPYGLLLTKIFEFYGIDTANEEAISAKEFFDVKGFGQCGLIMSKAGELASIEVAAPVSSSKPDGDSSKKVTEEEQLSFMAEVREFMAKMKAESAEFRKMVEKGFADMAARNAPKVEYDKVAAIVQKVLEDAELSDGEKNKADPAVKTGASSSKAAKDAGGV